MVTLDYTALRQQQDCIMSLLDRRDHTEEEQELVDKCNDTINWLIQEEPQMVLPINGSMDFSRLTTFIAEQVTLARKDLDAFIENWNGNPEAYPLGNVTVNPPKPPNYTRYWSTRNPLVKQKRVSSKR